MRVMVLIEEIATGERLWYDDGDWHSATLFMYRDGNYSCDCNRAWFFARAGRKPEFDVPCRDGELYRVVFILREDGEMFSVRN